MAKRIIYLHIGSEKTGTTAIQNFINKNRNQLKNEGIHTLQPKMTINGNCREFAATFTDPENINDDYFIIKNFIKTEDICEWQKKNKEKYQRFFQKSNENFLISSEHISSRISPKQHLELKHFCMNIFDKVVIIYYIRNPIDYAISQYSNIVKFGGTTESLPGPKEFENQCNHKKKIGSLEEIYGKGNLIIRRYGKEFFINNNSYDDFLDALRLNKKGFTYPKKIFHNPGLTNFSRMMLIEINKILPFYINGKYNRARKEIERYFEDYFLEGSRFYPVKEMVDLYYSYYEESNEWVLKNYFNESDTLFNNSVKNSNNTYSHIQKTDVEELAKFIVSIWNKN